MFSVQLFQVLNVLFGHNKFFVARKFNVICNFQLNAKTGPCLIIWVLYILHVLNVKQVQTEI